MATPPISTSPPPLKTTPPPRVRVRRRSPGLVLSTVKYLSRTDVHTFAFSVAANAILSFFPFVVLMMTVIRRVFHSRVMYEIVLQLLRDYLPAGQDFVIRNLNSMVNSRQRVQIASLLDPSRHLVRHFPASGSRPQPHLALREKPLIPRQSVDLAGTRVCLWRAGADFDCADCRSGLVHGVLAARLRHSFHTHDRISHDEGVRYCRQHRHLLPHLLGATQRESSRACRCCRRQSSWDCSPRL